MQLPRLVKMSGAGNDFIVLDGAQFRIVESGFRSWVRRICRRGLSVGADGVLIVEQGTANRVRVRFFNPDGGTAFCGNGSRCAARFAAARGLAESTMLLETAAGEIPASVEGERVELRLPAPVDRGECEVEWSAGRIRGRLVHAGVPHFVAAANPAGKASFEVWAPAVRNHPVFGRSGTNVSLVEHESRGEIAVRTWERGVEDETLSCGSGAVAAAFVTRLGGGDEQVRVIPASGVPIFVTLTGPATHPDATILAGDARFVFEGVASEEAVRGFGISRSGPVSERSG